MLDDELRVVAAADAYLRDLRLGRDAAETTTQTYAGALVLFLRWCGLSGRNWRTAAAEMPLFITWLRFTAERSDVSVVPGPGAVEVRGPRRVNTVLAAVREFLRYAVSAGEVAGHVLAQLYEVGDARDLPVEVRGEDSGLVPYLRARHRLPVPDEPVIPASDEEILALLRACRSARDRLIVLLLGMAGLRRGEVAGLRREDIHFMADSARLGCLVAGSHLHVVRRVNANGAWAKSRRRRAVPVDFLLVRAYDQYTVLRAAYPAADSDFLLVNLFRAPVGAPMRPGAFNELLAALSTRAGLGRVVHPHLLRHYFGTRLMDAGGALDEVQQLLGHAAITSTQVYVHPSAERMRAAVDRAGVPRAARDVVG